MYNALSPLRDLNEVLAARFDRPSQRITRQYLEQAAQLERAQQHLIRNEKLTA